MITRKKCCLLAFMADQHSGVEKKMSKFMKIGVSHGFICELHYIRSPDLRNQITDIYRLLNVKRFDIYILRFPGPVRLGLMLPLLLMLRLGGSKVYLEIPTPLASVAFEISGFVRGISGYLHIISVYLSPLLIRLAANRVIQSGKESTYFNLMLSGITKVIANPFPEKTVATNLTQPPMSTIRLVNCSYLHDWHGLDRLLHGLAAFARDNRHSSGIEPSLEVAVDIIGDGPVLKKLEVLAEALGVNHLVTFHGRLEGDEASHVMSAANIGIGTLGSHRVDLVQASPLKHRDYFIHGLPFILDLDDPDFGEDSPFVLIIARDDSPVNVAAILIWYLKLVCEYGGMSTSLKAAMNDSNVEARNEKRILEALFDE